ncbi:FimV/HubP family polar landmark protein [Shewanella sp. A14]
MHKGLIEIIILVFGLLGYIASAMAQVNHLSINSRQFELNSLPQFKVNVVARHDDVSQLTFYLRQFHKGEFEQQKLTMQRINRYLLQLNGSGVISDKKAQLIITETTASKTVTLAVLALFDAPYSLHSAALADHINNHGTAITHQTKTQVATISSAQPQSVAIENTSVPQEACLIERDNSDTLWRIANRYKQQWNTSVYGAMLAIFEVNLLAFSKQKIHLLLKNVPLRCPSAAVLAEYNNKQVDKKVFEMIEAKHAAQ